MLQAARFGSKSTAEGVTASCPDLGSLTAIITGAGFAALKDGSAGSIGYGIATAYAKEGANIVITGRNVKKLEDAKEELERWDQKLAGAMAQVESAYAKNRDVWVETLFRQIVGGPA